MPHTNDTPATATVLPQGTPISQNDVLGAEEAWHRVVVTTGQTSLGVFAWGTAPDFGAEVSLFDGSGGPGALVEMPTDNNPWVASGDRLPLQATVVGVSEVFVKVIPDAAGVLHISVEPGPEEGTAAGDIVINDDSAGFPLAVLDPLDGHTKQLVHPVVAGEAGDSLLSGLVGFYDFAEGGVWIYDWAAAWAVVATLFPEGDHVELIRANRQLDRLYVLSVDTGPVVKIQYIDNAGALDATVTTAALPTGSESVTGFATSPGADVAYLARSGEAIHVVSIPAGGAEPTLVAAPGDGTLSWDILVLTSGDLLVTRYSSDGVKVHRYAANGVELQVYDFGAAWAFPGGGSPPRTAYDPFAPDSYFWIFLHNDDPVGWSTFYKVAIDTGAIVRTLTSPDTRSASGSPPRRPTRAPGSAIRSRARSCSCPARATAARAAAAPTPARSARSPGSCGRGRSR